MGDRKITLLDEAFLGWGGDLLHPSFSRLLRFMHVPAYWKRQIVNTALTSGNHIRHW